MIIPADTDIILFKKSVCLYIYFKGFFITMKIIKQAIKSKDEIIIKTVKMLTVF